MKGFVDLKWIQVSRDLFEHGHGMLRNIGMQSAEGLILWAGQQREATFVVEAVLTPVQRALRTDGGLCVLVDGAELHRINTWLYQRRLQLVAQLHAHPTDAYHSDLDDQIPIITTCGGLSLVVPDFAAGPADLTTYAAYRLSGAGPWEPLDSGALGRLIRIVDDPPALT